MAMDHEHAQSSLFLLDFNQNEKEQTNFNKNTKHKIL